MRPPFPPQVMAPSKGCPWYLTASKVYDALRPDEEGFLLVDDEGDKIDCLWENCPDLNGGDWIPIWPVDWTKPIEARHPDGRVIEVVLTYTNSGDEDIARRVSPSGPDGSYWFREDGSHSWSKWRIRNRQAPAVSPELVDAINLHLSPDGNAEPLFRAIKDELEPKPQPDPLEVALVQADIVLCGAGDGTYDETLRALEDVVRAVNAKKGEG